MIAIYAGDSGDVIKRIRSNHCGGNVEASALRRHIAKYRGYPIKSTKRPSGSYRVRLDPEAGEQDVSVYLRTGLWKFVICNSHEEAEDFQWYVIDTLKPLMNTCCRPWNRRNLARYQALLAELTSAPGMTCGQLRNISSGPGVYVFFHETSPSQRADT